MTRPAEITYRGTRAGEPMPRRLLRYDLLLVLALAALALYPREKVLAGGGTLEIAYSGVTASPYMAVIYLAALVVLPVAIVSRRRLVPWSLRIFAVGCIVMFALVWPPDAVRLGGLLHMLNGVAAWFVGAWLGVRVLSDTRGRSAVVAILFVIVLAQVVVTLLQRSGVPVNPMDPLTAEFMGQRTNGLMSHPGNLGKNLFLIAVICLAIIPGATFRQRRVLWVTLALTLVPLGLSEARANIIAVLLLLLIWPFITAPSRLRHVRRARVLIPLGLVIASVPFAAQVASRFESDPEGGDRPELTRVGLQQIASDPIFGTGPNGYVTVVRNFNGLAAKFGYPVHNVFLLTAAELGIPLALFFWAAIFSVWRLAWLRRRQTGIAGGYARALLASTPGFIVILWTGWGMLGLSVFPLWLLTIGIGYGVMRTEAGANARVGVVDGGRSPVAQMPLRR